jgi:hypothetical protein
MFPPNHAKVFKVVVFLLSFHIKILGPFSSLQTCHMTLPFRILLFDHPNNIRRRVQEYEQWSFSVCYFLQSLVTSSFLGRNIFLSTWRCPYTHESGSRVRLGELSSGARLGDIYKKYIYIPTYIYRIYSIIGQSPARDTPHTNEFDSLEPEPSRTC